MWGNMRQKIDHAYSKFSFFHRMAINETRPLLQSLIDQAAKARPGVKAPTTYEVMRKYLDYENKLLDDYIGVLKKK